MPAVLCVDRGQVELVKVLLGYKDVVVLRKRSARSPCGIVLREKRTVQKVMPCLVQLWPGVSRKRVVDDFCGKLSLLPNETLASGDCVYIND